MVPLFLFLWPISPLHIFPLAFIRYAFSLLISLISPSITLFFISNSEARCYFYVSFTYLILRRFFYTIGDSENSSTFRISCCSFQLCSASLTSYIISFFEIIHTERRSGSILNENLQAILCRYPT